MNVFAIKSILIVPIFTRGKLWGVITFQDCINERLFDENCMELYRSAARLCAGAIMRAEKTHHVDEAMHELEHREKMMETLVKTAIIFFSRSETLSDEMMKAGVRLIADLINIDRLSVWRNSTKPDGLYGSQIYRWDKNSDEVLSPDPMFQDINYAKFSLPLEKIFLQGEAVNTPVSLLPKTSMLHSLGVKSVFLAPILSGNALWGFVCFTDFHHERHFDNDSAEMMRSAAFFIANTIIRNEMEREIIEKNELNHVMFDAVPVGLTMFDESHNIIDCNEAILSMLNAPKKHLIDHFYEFSPEYQPDGSKSSDKIHDLMRQTVSGEKFVREWAHCSSNGEIIPCELTAMRATFHGKSVGLGYVYDLRNVKKMEESIHRLESEVIKIYDDPLTDIPNRRYFDENLDRIIKSLARTEGTLSLLMVDIDHFKKFNDTYGHLEGDKCLQTVATILVQSIMRTDDFVARYGGEEFVVVLPHTDEHGARMVAEKMCENIRNRRIPHAKNDAADYVTISIGGTTDRVNRSQTGDDFIKRADEMLYLSKENGRNRYSDGFIL